MKYIVRAIALVMLASVTLAYEETISWRPPIFYVDGTPLLEQELDYYNVYCDAELLVSLDSIIGTWTATVDFPDTPGTHTCWLTVVTLLGEESDHSNTKVFTNLPPKPMAPVVVW